MPNALSSAEAVEELARSLMGSYHPELSTARIKYLFQEKAANKGGRPVLGKVQKCSGLLEHFADCDFIVIVAQDKWNDLESSKRVALVDHLLERCTGEEDPEDPGADMVWKTREPDVHEFATILKRYGAWTEDLQGFCAIAQGLDEIEIDEASTVVTGSAHATM